MIGMRLLYVYRTIKPEFKSEPAKGRLKSFHSKIESACTTANVRETAISTSALKLKSSKTLVEAPGTPVSDAWETQSGPVNPGSARSIIKTSVRKIILKVKQEACSLGFGSKTENESSVLPLNTVSNGTAVVEQCLDVEQKLTLIDAKIDAGIDKDSLFDLMSGLISEFKKDSVAATEWIKSKFANFLSFNGRMGDCFLQLAIYQAACSSTMSEMMRPVAAIHSYLSSCAPHLFENRDLTDNLCIFFSKCPVEESIALKIAANLMSCNSPARTFPLAALAVNCSEVKDFLCVDMFSRNEENTLNESLLLSEIIQRELLRANEDISESSVKDKFTFFVEGLFKRIMSEPSIGTAVLCRLIKDSPDGLCMPENLVAAQISRIFIQLALSIISSPEKFRVELCHRLSLVEALIGFASFVRPYSKRSRAETISRSTFFSCYRFSDMERAAIFENYCNIYSVVECETNQQVLEVHLTLVASSILDQIGKNVLVVMIHLASDNNIQTRIRSMRGLCHIISNNDPFALNAGFIQFVLGKLDDNSVTVRELALELLSKSLDHKTLITSNCIPHVLHLLTDNSTSIKKKAIRTLHSVMEGDPSPDLQNLIISGLLPVLKDEEMGVIHICQTSLQEMLLDPVLSSVNDKASCVRCALTIVEIVRRLQSNIDCLRMFFNSSFKSDERYKNLGASLVDVLFEILIKAIEENDWEYVKCILEAIQTFADQDHTYLSGHIRLLYELTRSNEMATVECSLKLLNTAIKNVERSSFLQFSDFPQHLGALILKGSETVIINSVDLLSSFSATVHDSLKTLEGIWKRLFSFLNSNLRNSTLESLTSPICRALFSLGYISSKCEDPDRLLDMFIQYYKSSVKAISFYSVQAISFALMSVPRLALKQTILDFIQNVFKNEDSRCCLVLLRFFANILESEESPLAITFETSMKPSEVNTYANVIQSFLLDISQKCIYLNVECQLVSLKILSLSLIKGFCHPHQVIPIIFGLATSNDREIFLKAQNLCSGLMESHSSFIFSNYSNLFRVIFAVHSVADSYHGYRDSQSNPESHLSRLYSQIRAKKTKRTDFIDILIYEIDSCQNFMDDYVKFLLEMLITLPVRVLAEAAYIFSKLNELSFKYSATEGEDKPDSNINIKKCVWILQSKMYFAGEYSMTTEYIAFYPIFSRLCRQCLKALSDDSSNKTNLGISTLSCPNLSSLADSASLELMETLLEDMKSFLGDLNSNEHQVKRKRNSRLQKLYHKRKRRVCEQESDEDKTYTEKS